MSIQWGRWNFDGAPLAIDQERRTTNVLLGYRSDGRSYHSETGLRMIFSSFPTTNDSGCEAQPLKLPSGAVLMFDGRLDNPSELIQQLDDAPAHTDVHVVAACYSRWGWQCLSRLLGDWSLTLWDPNSRSLLLARDFAGIRHLFYSFDARGIVWCTILDALIALSDKLPRIQDEYVAGWLGAFPPTHLTPFAGFHSVPPSSVVIAREGSISVRRYWNFDSHQAIRYRQDGDYEEHLRCVFSQSVRRRLRSDRPIVAELSGGMDSSSIVCFADHLAALAPSEFPSVETVSYYDDSEPNWNELPYIAKVEQLRGRHGLRVNLAGVEILRPEYRTGTLPTSPAAGSGALSTRRSITDYLDSTGSRVILSGLGGDEVMGGVATPLPELADHIARGNLMEFCRQSTRWCLALRQPFTHLVWEVLATFLPRSLENAAAHSWLNEDFRRRYRDALDGYPQRSTLLRAKPSFSMNMSAFDSLRRQLGCSPLSPDLPCEKRYPYLDRDLVEFVFSIPRNQVVRAGQRRSLMRRAFRSIVPEEIINRKRKAFAVRSPLLAFRTNDFLTAYKKEGMLSHSLGYIDLEAFSEVIETARRGGEVPIAALVRTVALEYWLRHLLNPSNALDADQATAHVASRPQTAMPLQREVTI